MTQEKPKFIFDECIGKPIVDEIARLQNMAEAEDQATVKHILDMQPHGIWDEIWAPKIVPEGWIIISGDRGKKGRKKGEKLPIICLQYSISHVLLGPSAHNQRNFSKLLTILSVWFDLVKVVPGAPKGSRFAIESATRGHGRLVPKPTPKTGTPPPPGMLF